MHTLFYADAITEYSAGQLTSAKPLAVNDAGSLGSDNEVNTTPKLEIIIYSNSRSFCAEPRPRPTDPPIVISSLFILAVPVYKRVSRRPSRARDRLADQTTLES